MEDDQNGRRPKWKTTKMEDDQNGRRPKWQTTKMENNKMEDEKNRRQPKLKMTTMEDHQIEDDRNGRRPKWNMTKMEHDQNGRQPKWKTTKMEDDQNGRRLKLNIMTNDKDELELLITRRLILKMKLIIFPKIVQSFIANFLVHRMQDVLQSSTSKRMPKRSPMLLLLPKMIKILGYN